MHLTQSQALQKGIEAHKAGKFQEADRYYTAILKENPKHPDANHNMGTLAVGVGKAEVGLPFFKKALEANPNIAQYWLSYINALIKLDKIADANAVLEEAISKGAQGDAFDQVKVRLTTSLVEIKKKTRDYTPAQTNILDELKLDKALKLAKKKEKDGRNDEARQIYRDILKKFSKNKRALDALNSLNSKTLTKQSKINEPPNDQLQDLVRLYTRGQYQEALNEGSQLLEQFPKSIRLYNIVGAANNGLGRQKEAIEAYKKAISFNPDYAEAHHNLGNALKDSGRLMEAIEAYDKAIKINQNLADAHNNKGCILKDLGNLDKAIESFKKAILAKPDFAEALYNIGNSFKTQGNLDEAIKYYNAALSMKSDYAEVHNNIGTIYQAQGKLDVALKSYSAAIAANPNYIEAYNNLGTVYHLQDKLEQAKETYRKALLINPDYGNAKHMLSSLIGDTTIAPPREYIENLFDFYAKRFESSLVSELEYKIPKLIRDILIDPDQSVSLGSVLDLGCGTGLLGAEIGEYCSKLEGIDLSINMLEIASQKNIYDKLCQFDITEYLSSMLLEFDYYIALDVFIYIGDISEIFRLIKSRTNNSGRFVFSTEHTELDGYHILKSGRYSHSKSYIERLCKEYHYNISHFSTVNLRKEKESYLTGGIYILEFSNKI